MHEFERRPLVSLFQCYGKKCSADQFAHREKRGVPKSMFGKDKAAKLRLTSKEHENFQRSHFS